MLDRRRPFLVRTTLASDGVRKLLVGLSDGMVVETVLIPSARRTTVCVSSQVGCVVGCSFCATASIPERRDLAPGEIVAQWELAAQVRQFCGDSLPPIENVVYMGMGEPFLNYDAVAESLEILIRDHGFHSRILTVSTIGIPHRIEPFGRRFPHVRLAVSLHAPDDARRDILVPINRRHCLADVLTACRGYQQATGRRIFFEYVLIENLNDAEDDALLLADLIHEFDATVNLIPVNPGGHLPAARPDRARVDAFRRALKSRFRGHVTYRRSRGLEVAAACGQLAARGGRSRVPGDDGATA